jgi:linoleoyl-CoA desaturase
MSIPVVKFNAQDKPEFFLEVTKRVNSYFKENNISKYANLNMKVKTVFMLLLYFIPFGILLLGNQTTFWPIFGLWVIMGFGVSGIGLSIMHDANHGAYSTNKIINSTLGFLINFLGAYHVNWRIQHNVLHHSFTNVDGYDEDITNPVMRFSPDQKRKSIFRFQAFYAPFFYAIMTIYWAFAKDYVRLVNYAKNGLLKKQGLSLNRALINITFHKIWYTALTVVLPIMVLPIPWWQTLIGFFAMHFIAGLVLALIFQPAHVVQETDFFVPDNKGTVENNWAIHQMKTTSNFAHGSIFFSWYIGGLNYQIEHHLFPHICHIHYKNLSPIVKEVAKKYNIPYHQQKTFLSALISHFSTLNQLGNGSYDKKMAAA